MGRDKEGAMDEGRRLVMARGGTVLAAMAAAFLAGPACRSAAPRPSPGAAPAAPADPVKGFVGQTLVLRHRGDAKTIGVKRAEVGSLTGECDVVVAVRAGAFERGTARLTLHTVGRPRVPRRGARQERCGDDRPEIVLAVSGFEPGASAADLEGVLGQVLQTPEAYLGARGLAFDLPAGSAPEKPTPEALVTARPERRLWTEAVYQDPARRVRHEGTVELEAVVGTDGRLHDVRLLTTLSLEHEESVRRVLPLWRFEPGRRGKDPAPVQVREQLVFRIYY